MFAQTYRLKKLSNSARVVLSIDLIWNLDVGVMGEFARLRGLKLRIADRILFAMEWRERIRIGRQLRVAVMSTGSLRREPSGWQGTMVLRNIPCVLLQDIEQSVQQTRGLRFKFRWWYKRVVFWYYSNRRLVLFWTLEKGQHMRGDWSSLVRTLGSAIAPGVCTWTTFWTNLIQHILTSVGAASHL